MCISLAVTRTLFTGVTRSIVITVVFCYNIYNIHTLSSLWLTR